MAVPRGKIYHITLIYRYFRPKSFDTTVFILAKVWYILTLRCEVLLLYYLLKDKTATVVRRISLFAVLAESFVIDNDGEIAVIYYTFESEGNAARTDHDGVYWAEGTLSGVFIYCQAISVVICAFSV